MCHSPEMILHTSSGLGGQIECAYIELKYAAFQLRTLQESTITLPTTSSTEVWSQLSKQCHVSLHTRGWRITLYTIKGRLWCMTTEFKFCSMTLGQAPFLKILQVGPKRMSTRIHARAHLRAKRGSYCRQLMLENPPPSSYTRLPGHNL